MSQPVVPNWIFSIVIPICNLLLAAFASSILFLYLDLSPITALKTMAIGAFGDSYGWGYTLYYTTSYIFTGLAVAIAYHCGLLNIGGEGQAYIGALGIGIICLWLGHQLHPIIIISLCIISGGIFGALWAFLPALLQAKRGSHIVITTIMFNFIAAELMNYLLVRVLKPESSMSAASAVFPEQSWIPKLYEVAAFFNIELMQSPVNLSLFWALICAIGTYYLIWKTALGYEIRATGSNPNAAKFAGIPNSKIIIIAMLISGCMAGFFGLNVVQGEVHQIRLNLVNNMGFAGIAVALMGRNHPLGIILASLLFGFLSQGGGELQFEYSIDPRIIIVLQGLIILFSGALEHMLKHPVVTLYLALSQKFARTQDTA